MLTDVWVLVLGDVARSPRMQYHVLSLLRESERSVRFFGYLQSIDDLRPELVTAHNRGRLQLAQIFSIDTWVQRVPRTVQWMVKLLVSFWMLSFVLLRTLLKHGKPLFVLVQTPPALPVLPVLALFRAAYGIKVIVDFHNLAFTLMKPCKHLNFVSDPDWFRRLRSPAVRLAVTLERFGARRCDASLTVTDRFADWLRDKWGIEAEPLHDKAPAFFRPTGAQEAHELLMKLRATLRHDLHRGATAEMFYGDDLTPATMRNGNEAAMWRTAPGTPRIVVSSTSWTPDEDFGLLLDALCRYDKICATQPEKFSPLLVIITGRGPDKQKYIAKLRDITLQRCVVRTAWLDPQDYAAMLAAADVGVSLHTSSSDLDLPMKVSDMLGCGTPVCAVDYSCANEQVQDGVTGYLFRDAEALCGIWTVMFASDAYSMVGDLGRYAQDSVLRKLSVNVQHDRLTWEEQWARSFPPIVFRATGMAL